MSIRPSSRSPPFAKTIARVRSTCSTSSGLRRQALYPDGRQASGADAYAAYGRDSAPVFARLGGRIVWRGDFELMLIGPAEERWDLCFIAEYPSVGAFVEMIRDPVYREAVKHRQAAVEDSRLIRLAPRSAGSTFADQA
jgi:uncharacterized protein (DUF1330 family)